MSSRNQQTAYPLRMPSELRSQLEAEALSNSRSLNAEITTRLEASLGHGLTLEKLVPAAKARELSLVARRRIPDIVRQRIIKAISKAIELGLSATSVEFADLELDGGLNDEDISELFQGIDEELINAGYEVMWDGAAAAMIFLWPQSGS